MFKTTVSRSMILHAALCLLPGVLYGQADPFGAPAAGGADPFGDAPGAPAAAKAPAAAAKRAADDNETDPVVLAIRAAKPTTPDQRMKAVEDLLNLGRPAEAKKYIIELLDAKPNEGTLVDLQRELGSALFLRMLREPRLAPEGPQLADAVLQAAYAAARDPARLSALIGKLSDPSPEVRYSAIVDLRTGGNAAAAALTSVLANADRRNEQGAARNALVQLRRTSAPPLLGALNAEDPWLLAQAIVVLAKLNAPQAIPHLLSPYFTSPPDSTLHRAAEYGLLRLIGEPPARGEAERFLARQVNEYLDGKLAGRPDYENRITFWDWDAENKTPIERQMPAELASLSEAARLANDLFALAPDNVDYRRLHLITLLETAKRANGLDLPLPTGPETAHGTAAKLGVAAIVDLLQHTVRLHRPVAATAALEVLRDIGDTGLLARSDGQPTVVAQALKHPDRRVRFAAAEAIMAFDPQHPYAGSSYLPEVLGYLASTVGTRRALVAHPRTDQAQTLAGMLNELGFDADIAHTGKAAVQQAVRYPDYEFILLSDALDSPRVRETLQLLRRDARTANLPIGIMAREESLTRMQQLTESDPLSDAFPRPHELAGISLTARRLLARGLDTQVTFEARIEQASRSLDQLIQLAENSATYPFYDLIRQEPAIAQAINTPALTEKAARLLGLLASSSAQRTLVTLASQNARDLGHRQAASSAFQVAVQRRGILLTHDEIVLQYDRYNRSAILDRDTQQVLGAILDSIEGPTRSGTEEGEAEAAPSE